MAFYLDYVPSRGVTKEEHDRHVSSSGRNFTDPFIEFHYRGGGVEAGGTVPSRSEFSYEEPKVPVTA